MLVAQEAAKSWTVVADLEAAGFEVSVATDAPSALRALESGGFAVAVVDSGFQGDGIAFCQQLWERAPGFAVVLIGPDDLGAITMALARGADDYVTLPLRRDEMVARVRAVLRRASRGAVEARDESLLIRAGEVAVDPVGYDVEVRGKHLRLPLREFALLKLLVENAGIVLSRGALLRRLWGSTVAPESTTLEVHVRRLRSKIEVDPAHPRLIVTVRGIGYRYEARPK
ncbi:MAG: response regulator transcription factor [Acidimicrobiales bacterium]